MSDESSTRRKGRKRLRYEHEWVRKKRKDQKDHGKAYTTYKGEQKRAKQLVSLSCRCPLGCAGKIPPPERRRVFEEFYRMGDHDTQNKYLFGLIQKRDVGRRRTQPTTRGTYKRNASFQYCVRLSDGSAVGVCKKTFCDIHAVGKRRVEDLCCKLGAGDLLASDARGKHGNRPHRIPDDVKQQIRSHIESFPRRQSHYSRSNNKKREYLPEGLSIAEMYRLYLARYESESGDKTVKEWLYRKIFNEEFNLSFGYPRSDTCQVCDELHLSIKAASTESDRNELSVELAEHHAKASNGYQSLRNDTELSRQDPSIHTITFDLQQNLPVPTLTHSSMFYLRQLWVYNLGIHVCGSGSATMCVWNECVAGRGSSEIMSCLFEYLSQLQSQATKLICYSDSCFGQNKNFGMICFWNSLIVCGQFRQIDHKFLVRGHTFLPNDRDFSHIEKLKPSAHIYVPDKWEDLIASARKTDPFHIQHMAGRFYDFTALEKQYTRRKKDLSKCPVLISKAVWMNFGQSGEEEHPNEVWLRYTYDENEEWSKVSLLKGRKKKQPEIDLLSLPKLYEGGHAMNPKKISDLEKMIPCIPPEYHQFYHDLKNHPTSTAAVDSEYAQ